MQNGKKAETVLLLGNYRASLTVCQMLASRGYRVITGLYDGQYVELDFWKSRYVSGHWTHPHPVKDPDNFFAALLEYKKEHQELAAVYPVEEPCARAFAEHPEWGEQLPPVIMNNSDVITRCVDKLGLMTAARDRDIPSAPFTVAMNRDELLQSGIDLGFPLVLRPASSLVALCFKKAHIIRSMEELEKLPVDWSLHEGTGVIAQKEVAGARHNVYFSAYESTMCGCLHSISFRTNSIDGTGQAVAGVSLPSDGPLIEYTKRIIDELGYSGVGCAQFMENSETGETTFLELNPRLPGHLVFADYSGLHMAAFLFDLVMTGQPDRTPAMCAAGIHYSWVSEDIKTVKTAWKKKEISMGEAFIRSWWVIRSGLQSDIDVFCPWGDCTPGNLALLRQLPAGRFIWG